MYYICFAYSLQKDAKKAKKGVLGEVYFGLLRWLLAIGF